MTFTYSQVTGRFSRSDACVHGEVSETWHAFGYSGKGDGVGKNNPDAQALHGVGPIPRGRWIIGSPYDTKTHGPFVLPLTPAASTETFGRDGFLIHGDAVVEPGTASEGCIILPRTAREEIARAASEPGGNLLEVT